MIWAQSRTSSTLVNAKAGVVLLGLILSASAYKQEDDPMDETTVNREMLEHALGALDALSPNLKSIVFPSGSRVSCTVNQADETSAWF